MHAAFPRISIVTPSFNQGEFIEETILSVLGQGYPNLEYIVIDGGSTDKTVEIIKKYESHITYWVSEKDNGQSHAINKGFSKATGDILGWLNSDDIYMPNCLAKVSTLMKSNEAAILYGNCMHFKEHTEELITWGSDVIGLSKATSLENIDFIIQPSTFWTKRTWNEVGSLMEDLGFAFDWEWFLRAKSRGVKFYNTSKCLSLYRIHDSQKSGVGVKKRQDEILDVYKKYSGRYANLFEMILSEDLDNSSFQFKLIRKALGIVNKPFGISKMLKLKFPNKYKGYSTEEIHNCLRML